MFKFVLIAVSLASLALSDCGRGGRAVESETHQAHIPTSKVSPCDLLTKRRDYNNQTIEITTFFRHGFEDFTVFDPTCPVEFQNIWIEYGGIKRSGTIYCCGVETTKDRDATITVNDQPLDLVEDEKFKAFAELVNSAPQTIVRATVIGSFFAGHPDTRSERVSWSGFGHLGVYSLLVIREVKEFDPHDDRKDLDYGSEDSDFQTDAFHDFENISYDQSEMDLQKAADNGRDVWRFDDPAKVAADALRRAAKLRSLNLTNPKQIESRPGSRSFQFNASPNLVYFVTVKRPYWLSFYARDPRRVVWLASGITKAKR